MKGRMITDHAAIPCSAGEENRFFINEKRLIIVVNVNPETAPPVLHKIKNTS